MRATSSTYPTCSTRSPALPWIVTGCAVLHLHIVADWHVGMEITIGAFGCIGRCCPPDAAEGKGWVHVPLIFLCRSGVYITRRFSAFRLPRGDALRNASPANSACNGSRFHPHPPQGCECTVCGPAGAGESDLNMAYTALRMARG